MTNAVIYGFNEFFMAQKDTIDDRGHLANRNITGFKPDHRLPSETSSIHGDNSEGDGRRNIPKVRLSLFSCFSRTPKRLRSEASKRSSSSTSSQSKGGTGPSSAKCFATLGSVKAQSILPAA